MTILSVVFIAVLFLVFLEVKYRSEHDENDTQTRKGDEDDAS